jgi:hypothetical protein
MDRAGNKALKLSNDELKAIYQVILTGGGEREIHQGLLRRNRSTVRRAYKVLREIELLNPAAMTDVLAQQIMAEVGYSTSIGYVQDLFLKWRAWRPAATAAVEEGNESKDPVPDAGLNPQLLRDDWDLLSPVLLNLKELGPMADHDYDLAVWYSRPEEPSWPVPKGRVCRGPDGVLSVRLNGEEKLEWRYLQQHLGDDPVWDAREKWKGYMCQDIAARMGLLQAVVQRIESPAEEGGLGCPVLVERGPTSLEDGHDLRVTLYYAFTLYDQLLSRSLGLAHGAISGEGFTAEEVIRLGNWPVIAGSDPAQRKGAVDYLLKAQEDLFQLPEVGKAKEAYLAAKQATHEAKEHLERIRLRARFPRGSVCDACRE